MKLAIATVATAAVIAAAVTASAASLGGITANRLSSGTAAILSCDPDGVTVTYTLSSGVVQSMTVSGVAPGCANGAMRAVLVNASATSIGAAGSTTVAGTSVTLTLSPQPLASAVEGVHISIVGP